MKRPRSVTWLALGVLSLSVLHAIRFGLSLVNWEFLGAQALSVPPLYLALTGFGWAFSALIVALGLWFGSPWAGRASVAGAFAFTLYYWVDRLLFGRSDVGESNIPFALGVNMFLVSMTVWITLRAMRRNYFGEVHDGSS